MSKSTKIVDRRTTAKPPAEPYATVQEAMEHFQVSRATLYRWIAEKRFTVYRQGKRMVRLKISEVQAAMFLEDAAAS